ncbi:sugar-binding domain-containing protein [Sphingobacterium anhuiense]|uniref:sugar-binding domain-containing protein n=1 Tax=Sphingobacterium anhuiense TaxID=493780 RepID=UPI003C2FB9BB
MKKIAFLFTLLFYVTIVCGQQIDLKGVWKFKLDPEDVGVTKKWQLTDFTETLTLPGTLASNNQGYTIDKDTKWTGRIIDSTWFKSDRYAKFREKDNYKTIFWLQPNKNYVGPAWYNRAFTISKAMSDQELVLHLERVHWETTLWIDGKQIGMQNALGVPHEYNLGKLKTGNHHISIRVDNRIKNIDVGMNAHSISDHTQTNWNGIVGQLHIRAIPKITVTQIAVYPDIEKKEVRIVLQTDNKSQSSKNTNFILQASSKFTPKVHQPPSIEIREVIAPGKNKTEMVYPMGNDFYKWDEFTPFLYQLSVKMQDEHNMKEYQTSFGMRKLEISGTQFKINDRLTFLRGTLDCAVFPLTGYPPTEITEWKRIYNVVKSHGLNHVRFHSWCPPKAAFEAADELGIYIQVEGGGWTLVGGGNGFDKWIYEESDRILDTYGNHPSFILYTYGNEPDGKNQRDFLGKLVNHLKKHDNRHLYTSGAGWPDIKENEFYNAMYPRLYVWGDGLKSYNNANPPSTDFDWLNITGKYKVPYISHEVGQWCAYPNFKEIDKYTGVLKAHNFEVFQETLQENKLEHLADSFLLASGKHQAMTYKADIEAALRTPGFAGFQLLGLSDFPGQGTALVGVLDAFWEEKGYISPEEFKTFSGPTVPLIRLPKMVYNNDESLDASIEIAHFGKDNIKDIVPTWNLTQVDGRIIASGNLDTQTIPLGNAHILGHIKYPLREILVPMQLKLTVQVGSNRNSWNIWVYPATSPSYEGDVHITDTLDQQAYTILEKGGKVLFSPRARSIKKGNGGEIVMGYSPIFWNTAWTNKQPPHVMGVLVNPNHPALQLFPTDYYSDFQWWGLVTNANALKLKELGEDVEPIVRIIDDWFTNQSLGLIIEGKIGKGKIIISSADLLQNRNKRLEVTQMKKSILHYMNSVSFNPQNNFEIDKIKKLFP